MTHCVLLLGILEVNLSGYALLVVACSNSISFLWTIGSGECISISGIQASAPVHLNYALDETGTFVTPVSAI